MRCHSHSGVIFLTIGGNEVLSKVLIGGGLGLSLGGLASYTVLPSQEKRITGNLSKALAIHEDSLKIASTILGEDAAASHYKKQLLFEMAIGTVSLEIGRFISMRFSSLDKGIFSITPGDEAEYATIQEVIYKVLQSVLAAIAVDTVKDFIQSIYKNKFTHSMVRTLQDKLFSEENLVKVMKFSDSSTIVDNLYEDLQVITKADSLYLSFIQSKFKNPSGISTTLCKLLIYW